MNEYAGMLAGLVAANKMEEVFESFNEAIQRSFTTDNPPMRDIKRSEVVRRFGLCMKVFRVLRGDKRWSIPKIKDYLHTYLRCELDGATWEPDESRVWVPDADRRVVVPSESGIVGLH